MNDEEQYHARFEPPSSPAMMPASEPPPAPGVTVTVHANHRAAWFTAAIILNVWLAAAAAAIYIGDRLRVVERDLDRCVSSTIYISGMEQRLRVVERDLDPKIVEVGPGTIEIW